MYVISSNTTFSFVCMRFRNLLLSKRTPLYEFHLRQSGKMVDFAGWSMPVQYPSLDIMGQLRIMGDQRWAFVEALTTCSTREKKPGTSMLTVMTNENGGIIDDTIVTVFDDHILMVLNAGCVEKDMKHIEEVKRARFPKGVNLEFLENQGLVAFQGPMTEQVLTKLIPELKGFLSESQFMTGRAKLKSTKFGELTSVCRCGYTGEDGFEISMKDKASLESLLDSSLSLKGLKDPSNATDLIGEPCKMAGLGARDLLRIESGLCLYGHEIDLETTPVEAGLSWLVAKERRGYTNDQIDKLGFPGYRKIMDQLNPAKGGPLRKLVGMTVIPETPDSSLPVPRQGNAIVDSNGVTVGTVTSGTLSPTVNKVFAIGYMNTEFLKKNAASPQNFRIQIRNGTYAAEVTKMPFIPHKYKR